jgi:hypothetical protein
MGHDRLPPAVERDSRWLRASVAFVWLATGVGVLHPYYREVGHAYLARLGLADAVMFATCTAEVLLGLRVALGRASTWLMVLQVMLIAGFTAILGWAEPPMLVHRFGVLTKNLPLVAVIVTAWLIERDGWSRRATWLLRGGMAVIWITEGLFPKLLFQAPEGLKVVTDSGLVPIDPAVFLGLLGALQLASGVAVLVARGWLLRVLLACQLVGLVVLPLLITPQDPLLWFHPFAPFTKNVPIYVGTWVVLRRAEPV